MFGNVDPQRDQQLEPPAFDISYYSFCALIPLFSELYLSLAVRPINCHIQGHLSHHVTIFELTWVRIIAIMSPPR